MAPMRRKSHGSIRSPHVKRDSQSQVIIEGWLYKLEGAALKQFKQRWCVLADFCLFFYKGPSEEKTTSSILLPSYKISPCTSDDKVSRKFSFKAEHQNMKTYYFAAEENESMKKWMNAMSLASIMQNFVRSEKYDTTFSSASNDDEDSGFTSYRSRRYTSQKLNSTYDSNFAQAAEPLKQRSNSYGDRMGEVYLGSGDKYPNDKYHKNIPCQNVPRRQPLYANAPPKPRRLTQSDSYGLYAKDCYDPEIAAIEASQFYAKPVDKMYSEHQKMLAYHQAEQYFPGSDPVIMGSDPVTMSGGMPYVDNYPPDNVNVVGEVPDLYRNQPPRPRSADFLEREVECIAVPDVALYPERRQPQRPKSSLEYYDRYIDSEDGNFDYYREAVRIQADNLYANKNLRKRQSPRPQAYDQRVNVHYMGNNNNNSCYMANEQVSPCYGSTIKDQTLDRYDDCANVSMSSSQNDHLTSGYGKQANNRYEDCTNVSMSSSQNDHLTSGYGRPPKVKEESMQRLLEWKQRMLQSPLTKRNHLQSNSSDNSLPITTPYKGDQQQKVFRELQANDTRFHGNPSRSNDYIARSHSASPQRHTDTRRRNESPGSQRPREVKSPAPSFSNIGNPNFSPVPSFSNIENPKFSPKMPEPSLDTSVDIPVENLYKEKVMYCVDSENNEILFSYDDTSPTSGAPKSLQTCHYPPQMHSFTTMPNVSNIGSDNPVCSKYEEKGSMERIRREERHSLPRSGPKGTSSVARRQRHTTYSSDDEDGVELREPEQKTNSEQMVEESEREEQDQPDRYQSSSPDYVNIGAICDDYVKEPSRTKATDCHKVNQAVLKPLEQVSKKCKALPELKDNSVSATIENNPDSGIYYQQNQKENVYQFDTGSANDSLQNQSFTSYSSKGGYESETEFDIKREDYYRASQIFYASTRVRNKQMVSKRQREVRRSSDVPSEKVSSVFHSYSNVVLSDSVSSLDKDVGIPLPKSPYKSMPRKREPDVIEMVSPPQKYTTSKSSDVEESGLVSSKYDEKYIKSNSESFGQGTMDKDLYGKLYTEKQVQSSEVPCSKQEVGKKLSYEEMRGQLLRKREAPPPNIVQDRIKKFETVDPVPKESKNKAVEPIPKLASSSDNLPGKETDSMRSIGKKNRHKPSRSKSYRRALHSDSEAVPFEDSEDSSDDLTMKSAPILLSPLSSVLADLRKTAESGKEKLPVKDSPPSKNAMKEYFLEMKAVESPSVNLAENLNCQFNKVILAATKIQKYEEHRKDLRGSVDEVEYLPMFGSKQPSKENEPEYVMMGGCKLSPNSPGIKSKKFFVEEEHVYNEPFSPPPSFLHDVYEKQKTKQFQFLKSSSSEDSLTENIYEKPIHRFPSSRNLRNESVQETNSILMSSLSCSNVTSVGRSNDLEKTGRYVSERNIPSRSNFHHYEQANLSVSVPDLLQLKDMKDSDASDADDEASRDFDTAGGMRLPSYQSPILNQFPGGSMSQARHNANASFELELLPFNRSIANDSTYLSNKELGSHSRSFKTDVKPLPTYEALYNVATYQQPCAQSTLKSAPIEKFQMQKLRVYTKGKKPEAPKIFPVPFDLEESEICKILERKDSTKAVKVEDTVSTSGMPSMDNTGMLSLDNVGMPSLDNSGLPSLDNSGMPSLDNSGMPSLDNSGMLSGDTSGMPSLDSSIAIDSDSLSENVAYATRREITPMGSVAGMPPNTLNHSYRPDVVPTVQDDERVPNEKYSPSKSPNSAPYYYSDLYSGQGINFIGQVPLFKRSDVPYLEKISPPKSNPSLLNNVCSRSPASSCKGDIGRKVNKINSKASIAETKDALNEKMKYWKAEGAKNNIKCSIDILESSKSKYLDAEKNKYEAGHTLEKTRSSSTMSYFKHRASTPDLNTCQYQSDEPVYENIVFQPKVKLQKRLSHSLERLPKDSPEMAHEINDEEPPNSPVYENLEFFNAEIRGLRENPPMKVFPKERIETPEHNRQVIISRNTSVFAERQFCNPVTAKPIDGIHQINVQVDGSDSDRIGYRSGTEWVDQVPAEAEADFLDQNVLRRVSEQHFFGKNFKQPKCSVESKNLHLNCPPQNMEIGVSMHFGEVVKDYKMDALKEPPNNMWRGGHTIETYDSDSSGSTSSCDEASIVSDNRYHINKIKSSDITRSISSEIHIGEPNHLKKLVQQSEGLMCKGKRLSVSAGDLLGKTHEELVLLLIQLRRNQAKILKAKDKLEQQMKTLKEFNQLNTGKHPSYQSKNDLLRQIQLLETQHEVTQPLVTLVDNMIKLGSLYGSSNRRSFSLPVLDTSQEDLSLPSKAVQSPEHFGESSILTKLLADESSFQKRISEIYSLDKGLRHETNSITSLHQDKEMLEYTLSGMRNKIFDHQDRPAELQKLKKQQKMIEKELVRVKRLLSTSAKKIEDAASKNDQMEKDILYLRQILKEALKTGSTETKTSQHNRADIEAELSRVQNVLDELANHRHEINNTVLKLKGEAPPSISKEADFRASPSGASDDKETTHLKKVKKGAEVRASPTGVAGSAPLPVRKKQHSMYLETDLDTLVTRDLAMVHEKELDDIPVYVNAEEINNPIEEIYENLNTFDSCNVPYSHTDSLDPCSMQDINDADERMKRFYGILPKEKPSEIKTVRIVKRQSERRNRERDKKRVTYDDQSSVWIVDEPDLSSDDLLEIDEGIQKGAPTIATRPSSIHLLTASLNRQSNSQSAHERLFGNAATKTEKSFSSGSQSRAYSTKRTKRRHYTVSGYQYVLDPQFAHYFKDRPRSRDDVDMERCLRTANTPDIVRSTIKKNDVFDDRIIERELMLPQKIEIPERYVEIEPEQLSAKERLQRSIKAENICKMLSETTTSYEDVVEERSKSPEALHKKLSEEKRKRAHLLNLNRAIAREVVEKSKAVAVFATLEHMLKKPLTPVEEDLSPMAPLPITQQRYNFLA